ncbi:transporter substrate-binding domain-containing protein [Bradyrhizobium sp. 76]|nr:transporter substrate-binding domain-containing protein [Bradyrhizobium sp. 76]MCK1406812.1 transporter substrate-binding domain-containing protein [Bradyrhizobium sp. 76]
MQTSVEIKLAVITGSSQEAYAVKQGIARERLVRVPDIQAGVATVTSGRADALVVGQFSIPNAEQKGVEGVVDKEAPMNGIAAAFRKEDIHFRDAFNEQLSLLRRDGNMQQLYFAKYRISNWDTLAKFTEASDIEPSCD